MGISPLGDFGDIMGKFDGKLLVSDMDKTLLNDNQEVSEKNLRAIRYFMSEGGKFSVASGRIVTTVRHYAKQIGINAPVLLYNGAMLYSYDEDRIMHECFIEEDRKAAIKRVYEEHSEFGIEIYSEGKGYIMRECFLSNRFENLHCSVCREVPDEVWQAPWTKVLIIGHKEDLDKFTPIYKSEYDRGNSVRSGDNFLDLVSNEASKGRGLKKLAQMLDIPLCNVYAAGDNMNDYDMIEIAGHGCAVGNAVDELKSIADFIVPPYNEDAIAHIIYNIIK